MKCIKNIIFFVVACSFYITYTSELAFIGAVSAWDRYTQSVNRINKEKARRNKIKKQKKPRRKVIPKNKKSINKKNTPKIIVDDEGLGLDVENMIDDTSNDERVELDDVNQIVNTEDNEIISDDEAVESEYDY